MEIRMNAYEENEMRCIERELKNNGFKKTADCMWAKIYEKNNEVVVVSREF